MSKKNHFLGTVNIKQATKEVVPALVRGGMRTGGFLGGAYLRNTIIPKTFPPKFIGPGLAILGLAAEVFLKDDYARSAAQGLTTYGMVELAAEIIPAATKPAFGLSGVSNDAPAIEGAPQDATPKTFWAQQAEIAAKRAAEAIDSPEVHGMGELTTENSLYSAALS